MGKVEVAKAAAVVSTSPGRMIGEAVGALKADATAVVTASMVAVAAVFMVIRDADD